MRSNLESWEPSQHLLLGTEKPRALGNEGHRETKGTGKRRAQGNEGHRETKGTGKPRAQGNQGHRKTKVPSSQRYISPKDIQT